MFDPLSPFRGRVMRVNKQERAYPPFPREASLLILIYIRSSMDSYLRFTATQKEAITILFIHTFWLFCSKSLYFQCMKV